MSAPGLVLHVRPNAERAIRGGHPWLYDQAIRRQRGDGQPGDLAALYDHRNRFLAIGLYDPTSPLRVRILQHGHPAPIDSAWYRARLTEAARLREPLARTRTTGLRLVHGENDGLPGLVIDRYHTTLVLKLYTVAWVPRLRDVVPALEELWPAKRLVLRLSRLVQQHEQWLQGLRDGIVLAGAALSEPIVFEEHGLRFEVDPRRGQKTGFFLDQRENRAMLEQWCRHAMVLDVFAYTGAFSVYAARGGAREVVSLDASAAALAAARRNMALNRRTVAVARAKHTVMAGQAFERLARLRAQGRRFDAVVLDPPTFANAKDDVPKALETYRRLAGLGLGVLRPGGLLVASSCSGQISAPMFFGAVRRAASASGRTLRELARTGHPLDHPVRFPEGAYLKCLFALAV